jgi:arylsulfatase A-like enzyme
MPHKWYFSSGLIVLLLTWVSLVSPASAKQPNIVFILADDMGYGDVQALNPHSKIHTPNLDSIATAGMTFIDAHTPSAVCTPTRYGLLTGRYCWRSRLKRGVLNGYGAPLIEPSRPTIASFLRKAGYHTGIVGKWHLGLDLPKAVDGKGLDFTKPVGNGPQERGFDFSYIIPASLDFPPYIYIENGRVTNPDTVTQPAVKFPGFLRNGPRSKDLVMEDCLDDLLEQATRYIHKQSQTDQPFFLYFPLPAPHKPVIPHSRFQGKTKLGLYGDFVAQVDWTVGEVLRTIRNSGIEKDTLIVYSSDNGSYMYRNDTNPDHVTDATVQAYQSKHHTANHVFRGTKADIWEAGHHVPFLVRWPGTIAKGSHCQETICLTDFFATAAEIVGQELPAGAAPDSFSLLGLFQGKSWKTPRAPVIHHSAAGMFAIRSGKWKLVLGNGSGGRQAPKGQPFRKPYQLFDLNKDIEEQHNVINEYPEVAETLEALCEAIRSKGSSR